MTVINDFCKEKRNYLSKNTYFVFIFYLALKNVSKAFRMEDIVWARL